MDTKDKEAAEIYLKNLFDKGSEITVKTIDEENNEMELPVWFDEELFKKGQKYYRDNIFAMFASMLCGLIAVLAIPSILKVLICTNKSSSPATAYRRYVKTIFHVIVWHWHELKPGSPSWKSLELVRRTHTYSSQLSSSSECGIISQKDMALTQFGFMGFSTVRGKLLGMPTDPEFYEATVHLWRVIAYLLGIEDEFNLCSDSWQATQPRIELMLEKVYKPALENADTKFYEMTEHLINGLWTLSPLLRFKTCVFATKRLARCYGYKYLNSESTIEDATEIRMYKQLPIVDRAAYAYAVFVHQYLLQFSFIFRIIFNLQTWFYVIAVYYFPILAIRFGFKKSYVRLRLNSKISNNDQNKKEF